jgi:hypothetical protein
MPYPVPEHLVEKIRLLASQGLSAAKVALLMPGMTRSGILGLAFRRGFQFGGKGGPVGDGQNTSKAPRIYKPKRPKPMKIETVVELPRMVTLEELTDDDCRYIFGDALHSSHRYCGSHGYPWCHKHRKVCYETPQERRRASEEGRPMNGKCFRFERQPIR